MPTLWPEAIQLICNRWELRVSYDIRLDVYVVSVRLMSHQRRERKVHCRRIIALYGFTVRLGVLTYKTLGIGIFRRVSFGAHLSDSMRSFCIDFL